MRTINSVRGPIDANKIGLTLMHEHLVVDTSCWYIEPKDPTLRFIADAPIEIQNFGLLRRAGQLSRINQIVKNVPLAIEELNLFKQAGGSSVFDCTCQGLSRHPNALRTISERTGVNIIAGTGFYIEKSHPRRISKSTIDQIQNEMILDLVQGMDGTNIRAGFIGEIGISPGKITRNEEKVLLAAGRAQAQTGVPLTVHCWEPWLPEEKATSLRVADILLEEGADLKKVFISHVDWTYGHSRNWSYAEKIASKGVYISFDGFGAFEWPHGFDTFRMVVPTDFERCLGIKELISQGYLSKILLSHDICWKTHLVRYGGYGYAHILKNVIPILKYVGLRNKEIRKILFDNPRQLVAS